MPHETHRTKRAKIMKDISTVKAAECVKREDPELLDITLDEDNDSLELERELNLNAENKDEEDNYYDNLLDIELKKSETSRDPLFSITKDKENGGGMEKQQKGRRALSMSSEDSDDELRLNDSFNDADNVDDALKKLVQKAKQREQRKKQGELDEFEGIARGGAETSQSPSAKKDRSSYYVRVSVVEETKSLLNDIKSSMKMGSPRGGTRSWASRDAKPLNDPAIYDLGDDDEHFVIICVRDTQANTKRVSEWKMDTPFTSMFSRLADEWKCSTKEVHIFYTSQHSVETGDETTKQIFENITPRKLGLKHDQAIIFSAMKVEMADLLTKQGEAKMSSLSCSNERVQAECTESETKLGPNEIHVTLQTQGRGKRLEGSRKIVVVDMRVPFGVLRDYFAEQLSLSGGASSIKQMQFDGESLDEMKCPTEYEMEDADVIDVII